MRPECQGLRRILDVNLAVIMKENGCVESNVSEGDIKFREHATVGCFQCPFLGGETELQLSTEHGDLTLHELIVFLYVPHYSWTKEALD
jgi:hypothetical protein